MKSDKEEKADIINEMMTERKPFSGYTIEQVKYQRALVALKREFMKEKVNADIAAIKQRMTPGKSKGKSSSGSGALSVISTVAGKLNYLEYVMIGASVFGTVRKIAKTLRRK